MWVTTDEGRLVNLDQVEQIVIEGGSLVALLPGPGGRSIRLVKVTKAQPSEYLRTLGSLLAAESRHTDLNNLG